MKVWRLKKGAEARARRGHPWVFAGELVGSTREVLPGEIVELRDASDRVLGMGFGHPTSQIAFRRLSANARETLDSALYKKRLVAARALRGRAGWTDFSHRWVYADSDGLPGFVIDLFRLEEASVAVVQASTAGAERTLPLMLEALQEIGSELASELGLLVIIEAPTSTRRPREGLTILPKRQVFGPAIELTTAKIRLSSGLKLQADLLGGQKTGFFLDQQANAMALRQILRNQNPAPCRVLDLCCYYGQWAAHIADELKGANVEAHLLDASRVALEIARSNVEACGARVETICGDALEVLSGMESGQYDVVICDPPAFVKKRGDLEAGTRAYTKMNREAMRLTRPGGLLVASSCSGLVSNTDYLSILAEAGGKAGRLLREIYRGGHAPDHPIRPDFPEGEYLKCTIGQVDYPF